MKYLFLIILISTTTTFSQINSCHRINPFPGVDSLRMEKLDNIKKERLKKQEQLKIDMSRLELDLKEILISGIDLIKIKEICNKKSKLWAELQYLPYEADAKRKKVLTKKEWQTYSQWKINFEKKKMEYKKNNCEKKSIYDKTYH